MYNNLYVGERVDREDGRFYIPVHDVSDKVIVLRITSDAFDGHEPSAILFAQELVNRFNYKND